VQLCTYLHNRQVSKFVFEDASCGPGPRSLERYAIHAYSRGDFEQKLDASTKDPSEYLECPSQSTGDAQTLSLLKLLFGNPFEHRLAGRAQHCEDEATRNVSAVVSVLIVDHVAAGCPERVSSAEDAGRFTLELEQHLTLNHVTESRTTRKSMWRVAGCARWMVDEDSHHMGIIGNQR